MGIYCPSFSKVNVGLKILKQRDDGYHNIYTLFQKLDFGDELLLEKMENGCLITSNVDWIPTDKSNICYKAYNALKTLYPALGGICIQIKKKVPIGSGLGGGSANGAAVLKELNNLYDLGLSIFELEKVGVSVGADVSFFIRGGTQLGEGIGNKLTPLPNPISGIYLLVIPNIFINTSWAYTELGKKLKFDTKVPNFRGFFNGDISSYKFEIFENDFERIVIPAYPEIGSIKQKLLKLGARFASLSGSGSTVFGIFDDDTLVTKAESFFQTSYQTILANPA